MNFPSPSPIGGVTLKSVFCSAVTTVVTFWLLSFLCFTFSFFSGVSQDCLPKKLLVVKSLLRVWFGSKGTQSVIVSNVRHFSFKSESLVNYFLTHPLKCV